MNANEKEKFNLLIMSRSVGEVCCFTSLMHKGLCWLDSLLVRLCSLRNILATL